MGIKKDVTDVEIVSRKILVDEYFQTERYDLRHRKHDGGWSEVLSREVFQRGAVVCVLAYDAKRDVLILIEQFRAGAFAAIEGGLKEFKTLTSPWLIECVAGVIDPGETSKDVAIRELMEEANCPTLDIQHIYDLHISPGGVNEPLAFYCANVDSENAVGIHGLDSEGEDIRVFTVAPQTAFEWVANGQVQNGATVIALQWFQLNYEKVKAQWS